MFALNETTSGPANSWLNKHSDGHEHHHPWATEVCSGQQICFDCAAEILERQLPPTRKFGFVKEVQGSVQQLPQHTAGRVAHYLLHSTTFVESVLDLLGDEALMMLAGSSDPAQEALMQAALFIDEAAFKHNPEEPPHGENGLAAKLHKRLLSTAPRSHGLLLLLKKLIFRPRPHSPPAVLQDPELWGSLSAALRVAVKAAAPDEVEITLCCFSTLLQTPGGGGKAALLVSFCLPHITAALRVVPPTHPLVPLLLHGVLNCFLVPQLSPQVHEHPKMLLQLGESLQAVFASDAVTAEVQQLALQLLQQLFSSLPETCKVIFVEEICIVDWLLETARNGKSVAHDAVQCLQQNIFASPAFLPHHLDTTFNTLLCIARRRQGSRWLVSALCTLVASKTDWVPDAGKLAAVLNAAAASICCSQVVSPPLLQLSDIADGLVEGKRRAVQLNATADADWGVGILSLAAQLFEIHSKATARNSRKGNLRSNVWLHILHDLQQLITALKQTENRWPPAAANSSFGSLAQIILLLVRTHRSTLQSPQNAEELRLVIDCLPLEAKMVSAFFFVWRATCPAAEQDQIVFLNCAFSTLFVDSKEDRFPPEVFMEAKLFVTRADQAGVIRRLISNALNLAANTEGKRLFLPLSADTKLSFLVVLLQILIKELPATGGGKAVKCDVSSGVAELMNRIGRSEQHMERATSDCEIISISLLLLSNYSSLNNCPYELKEAAASVHKLLVAPSAASLQTLKHPRIVVCLAGIVFRDPCLTRFRESVLQYFATVWDSLVFAEWRSWSTSVFARHLREALQGLFGAANEWMGSGQELQGVGVRLSQFVHYDILLCSEGLLPLLADGLGCFPALVNEVLLEESAASHWQPESVSWIVSQALKRHSLHAPVFGRLEALLQIIDRCVAAEVEWTESGGSAASTANVALAIQAASLYLLNNKSIDGGKALQLTMKLHHLAGVARLSSSGSPSLIPDFLAVVLQCLFVCCHGAHERAAHSLRRSPHLLAVLKRSIGDLAEAQEKAEEAATLALVVLTVLLVQPLEERMQLPDPLLAAVLNPLGDNCTSPRNDAHASSSSSTSRILNQNSFSFLLSPTVAENVRSAACLLLSAIFAFQLGNHSDEDVAEVTSLCINAAAESCTDTGADAAILCLCSVFTCGSIHSLLRSCLVCTTFSLFPLCNKFLCCPLEQQTSSKAAAAAVKLSRGPRAILAVILAQAGPIWFSSNSLCTAEMKQATQDIAKNPANAASTQAGARLLLHTLHGQGEIDIAVAAAVGSSDVSTAGYERRSEGENCRAGAVAVSPSFSRFCPDISSEQGKGTSAIHATLEILLSRILPAAGAVGKATATISAFAHQQSKAPEPEYCICP